MKPAHIALAVFAWTMIAFPPWKATYMPDEVQGRLVPILVGLAVLVALLPAKSPRRAQAWIMAGVAWLTIGVAAFMVLRTG